MPKIKFKRGLKENIPVLDEGEPGFAKDTEEVFIGTGTGNVQLAKQDDVDSVKEEVLQTNSRFDELKLVDANAEVLDARGGEVTLGDRLDKSSAILDGVTISLAERALDVKAMYGAKGDGVTDDTPAIQNAFNDAVSKFNADGIKRVVWFPYGLYKTSASIIASDSSFIVKMDGYLYIDKTVKYGFDFTNITALEIDLRIKGNNMAVTDFINSTDYSTNVTGLCVGLRIQNCQGVVLNAVFKDYYGRGIESIGCWQLNWGFIYGRVVGQFVFIKNPVGTTRSGIGSVGSFHGEELTGSYFNGTDITIQYYENYIGYYSANPCANAITFDNCGSLWIDLLTVGCTSADYMVKFLNCAGFNVKALFAYGHWSSTYVGQDISQGIYISGCHSGHMKLNTSACKGNALTIEGIKEMFIEHNDIQSQNNGVIRAITGNGNYASEIKLTSRYRSGTGYIIENTSTDNSPNDGLKVLVNGFERASGNNDDVDLNVTDANASLSIDGRITKVSLPAINQVTINAGFKGIVYTPTYNYQTSSTWSTWTPSLTWTGATPNGISKWGYFKVMNKTVFYKIRIAITDANNTTGLNISLPIPPKTRNILDTFPVFKSVAGSISEIQMRLRDDGTNNDISSLYFGTSAAGSSLTLAFSGFYEID
jgi:hypothetical protein